MKMLVILLSFLPAVVLAQDYPGMNQADMQKMMQQMKKMQSCMENIDRSRLKKIEARSNQMEAEIKSLCASGKRDQAQDKVLAFAREMSKDPALKELKNCGEQVKSMMPKMPYADIYNGDDENNLSAHVCD